MEMRSLSSNSMRELLDKANKLGINKDDFINIMQSKDGIFLLTYFAEED